MNNKKASTAITRRKAVKIGSGAIAAALIGNSGAFSFPQEPELITQQAWGNPYRDIRGFNYQPSYEATGYNIWRQFRPEKFEVELGLGKKYFPGINTVRYWLSFDAFAVDQSGFAGNFETALDIAHHHGLKVIPTLFNNWHSIPDFGGISEEMLRYWFVSYGKNGEAANYVFRPYLEKVVGVHATDKRILAWDLCNEPHNSGNIKLILDWLSHSYGLCKKMGVSQPVSVSVQGGPEQLNAVDQLSDLFLIHPYFAKPEILTETVDFARQRNKGVLATECCWGSLDDAERVKIVLSDCGNLSRAGIGIMPHALHESLVGDLHRAQFGVLSSASSMHFIAMDGSLRAGHEVFNDF
jgi:hypothetical protein